MIKKIGSYNDLTGKYRKSFYLKNVGMYRHPRFILANRRFNLTHLIEHGHTTRDGLSRTAAHPHWEETEQHMVREYERRLREELSE